MLQERRGARLIRIRQGEAAPQPPPPGVRTLSTSPARREAAKGLYRRFGLAPAGLRKGYYLESGEDAIVMWAHDIDDDAYSDRLRRLWDEVPGPTLVEHPR